MSYLRSPWGPAPPVRAPIDPLLLAEEGSLAAAVEKRLHTAQPSLSRQIRDLELELGVQL